MGSLVEKAIAAIRRLPEAEQEAIARDLLERIAADAQWAALFADPRSENVLERLTAQAEAEIARRDVCNLNAATNTPLPIHQGGKVSVVEYLAFIDTRPGHERWQLIDGVPLLMPQPTLRHQRIASNLCHVLTEHFRTHSLDLLAIFRIGLIVPGAELFRPFGDLVVADSSSGQMDTAFVDRFYLVAEVLSDSNTDKDIAAKSRRCLQHPLNLSFLLIQQKQVRVEVRARATGWEPVELNGLDAALELPEWGFRIPLAALYEGTLLAVQDQA